MVLACALSRLDDASQNDVMNRLPWTADYDMDCFATVARLTQRLGDAVGEALAAVEDEAVPGRFVNCRKRSLGCVKFTSAAAANSPTRLG